MNTPLRSSPLPHHPPLPTHPPDRTPAALGPHAHGLDDDGLLVIAAELGYSESAFVRIREGNEYDIRFFSPLAEVAFCGHATIATGVAIAERSGPGRILF